MASDQFGPPYKTAQSQSAQLCRLLVDCGCHALRVTFDNIHPPEELYSVLSSGSVQATLKSLFKRKILSPAQWEMLYPVIPSFVSSANFDATLLMVLLRSICHLRSPANGWDNFPSSTDRNIEDDIARIRWYRNAWAHQTSLDCDTFDKYWQDIRGILMRLGLASYGTAIDELRSSRMDPDIEEYYQDTLSQWQREEDDLKKLWQMDVEVHNLVEEIHHGDSNGDTASPSSSHYTESERGRKGDSGMEPRDAACPADLIDTIRKLYSAHRGWLSPFPWCEEFHVHLDDITTRISSVKTERRMGRKEIELSSIFRFLEGCTQQTRRVLILGEPGIGKSTVCQKFCYDWAKVQPADVGLHSVLLLKCRDINCDLWEAIDDQLLPRNIGTEEREQFFQYIRKNQSNVLLVLDGLDELPSNKMPVLSEIIQGRDLPNCNILATSRDMDGQKVKNSFDTLLEIQGFTEEDARIFISNHFKRIRPCVIQELLDKAKRNHKWKDMMENPLTTALLCLLCEDLKDHLPESKTQLYQEATSSVLRGYFKKEGVFTTSEHFSEIDNSELLQLGSLAFCSLVEKKSYLEDNELPFNLSKLRFLSTESSSHPKYFFPHKSFQEFLAAVYLSHQLMCGKMDPEVVVIKHCHELKGVLPFTTGLIWKEDTALCLMKSLTSLINHVNIDKGKELFHGEDYFRVALDCIGECGQENLRRKLARFLGSLLTIEEVAFRDGSSGDSSLVELLKANESLKKLKLCKRRTRGDWDNVPWYLAEFLQVNGTLTELELSGFGGGGDAAKLLFEALKMNTTLHRLKLRGSVIGTADACSLASSLNVNRSLTTLDLSDNEIGFSGVACLAEALKVNISLAKLNLSGNNIGDLAAVALSESLKSNTTVTSLNLSRNGIGEYGVRSLVELLAVNASLMILDLSENEIGDAGAVALAQALKINTALAVLILSKNGLGDVAALALAEALKANASLTTLGLSENNISGSGAKFLGEAIVVCSKLSTLNLSSNCIDDTGACFLAEAIKQRE